MQVTIESKHSDLSDELRAYIHEKVGKLDTYFNKITSTEVFMRNENGNFELEIKMNVPEDTLFVKGVGNSFTAATDIAVDTMKNALTRYKGKTLHRGENRPTDNV